MKVAVVLFLGALALCHASPITDPIDIDEITPECVDVLDTAEEAALFEQRFISFQITFKPPLRRGMLWKGPIGNINPNRAPFYYWDSNRFAGIILIRDRFRRMHVLSVNILRPSTTTTTTTPAPVEETPVEEIPVEETPVEETPVEETPVEETPVEETPLEETPVDETPIEETPVEEPVQEEEIVEEPVEEEQEVQDPVEEEETVAEPVEEEQQPAQEPVEEEQAVQEPEGEQPEETVVDAVDENPEINEDTPEAG